MHCNSGWSKYDKKNIQSDILKLTNELSKNGIIDNKTKKYFENIDKGIQKLISNSKKK